MVTLLALVRYTVPVSCKPNVPLIGAELSRAAAQSLWSCPQGPSVLGNSFYEEVEEARSGHEGCSKGVHSCLLSKILQDGSLEQN